MLEIRGVSLVEDRNSLDREVVLILQEVKDVLSYQTSVSLDQQHFRGDNLVLLESTPSLLFDVLVSQRLKVVLNEALNLGLACRWLFESLQKVEVHILPELLAILRKLSIVKPYPWRFSQTRKVFSLHRRPAGLRKFA